NVLGRKLNKIMNLHDFDYLRKISKNLVNEMGDVITFEALESAGYNVDVILSVVNVFKLYCNQILEENHISGKSLFSRQCALLGQSLSDLRNLTGIDNPYEDSAELDFDNDRFVQLMATFSDSMKKLKKYETYAPEQVNMFIAFQERFTELKKVVSVEREAMKNPININKQYIEQMLKKSKYKDAICDLHVRLQFELNRLFNRNNASTFDLLSDLNMKRYLDEKEINSMHLLRKCRNEFQHPKAKRDVQYSERIIREWCSVVEKLGGISNELRGEN
ncbi:MAG: hypothetical protein LIO65_09850, partial [Odoribacter sp.]|nr:hypothetical protein [Odoribacter sp.]